MIIVNILRRIALVTLLCVSAHAADAPKITAATLIDRAMIEDLLIDYYGQLGSGKHDFSYWFAPDGVLDVNGEVGQGKAGIEKIYKDTAARSAGRKGTFRKTVSRTSIALHGLRDALLSFRLPCGELYS